MKLLLLDKSYKMKEYAKKNLFEKFGDLENIKFVISDATSMEPLRILHSSIRFNKIIFNHSFHHICNSVRDIEATCKKWKRYLLNDGEIIICLHNSVIKFPKNSKYERWRDPLKDAIRRFAISNNIELIEEFEGFSISEIKEHFEKEGFYLCNTKIGLYERLMEDRLDMWRVPGIFKRFLNLDSTYYDKYYNYLESIHKEIVTQKTAPTTVFFLKFKILPDYR